MRIIGRLADPLMQITVFEHDNRFPVQFERNGLTQTYRFRKGENLNDLSQLKPYVDQSFRRAVLQQFDAMGRIHSEVSARIAPLPGDTEELPTII